MMTAVDTLERQGLPETGSRADPVVALSEWLMEQGAAEAEITALFGGICERLCAAGLPLVRGYLGFRTLHPLFSAVSLLWRPGEPVKVAEHPHGTGRASRQWRESPFAHLVKTRTPTLRRRLTGPGARLDFTVLPELRDLGFTDYFAFAAVGEAAGREEIVGSWATARKGGYRKPDLEVLQRIQRWLWVACKLTIQGQIARNALAAYLGPTAAEQVLGGQIRRGDGRSIHAAIFYSDLRNSTELAGAMEQKAFLELLNGYFECTAGAVLEEGGDVLLMIGDAVLAIFPIEKGRFTKQQACAAALMAARQANLRLAELNRARARDGHVALAFGVGLHVGTLMYGNIGLPGRLEFTATGQAVNEAARLEELTKSLGRPVVASAAFAQQCGLGDWHSLGHHDLRGLGCCHEIFVPADGDAAPAAIQSTAAS